MSLRFHLFVSDVDSGNENIMCKRVGVSPEMKRFSIDLPRAVKKGCTLEVECRGLWKLWWQANFF